MQTIEVLQNYILFSAGDSRKPYIQTPLLAEEYNENRRLAKPGGGAVY